MSHRKREEDHEDTYHQTDIRRRRCRRGRRCGLRRPELCAAGAAEGARRAQHHRRRRQPGADAEGHRELPQGEAQPGLADHLHQGAGAGTRRQDQGAAGCRPRRHRPRADRHRCALRRHRPEALGRPAPGPRGSVAEARRHLSAGRRQDAGARQGAGRRRHLLSRPARCSNTCPTR